MADTLDSLPSDGAEAELLECSAMASLVDGAEDLHRWHRQGHSSAVLPVPGVPSVTRLPSWPSAAVFSLAARHLSAPPLKTPPALLSHHLEDLLGLPVLMHRPGEFMGLRTFPSAPIPPEHPAMSTCLSTAACHEH